jgi:uncharacterized protein YjdB
MVIEVRHSLARGPALICNRASKYACEKLHFTAFVLRFAFSVGILLLCADTVLAQAGSPLLRQISIAPNPAFCIAGQTVQLSALGFYSDGSTRNLSSESTWTSSNEAIVVIENSGIATCRFAGEAVVTARLGGLSGSANVVATPPVALRSLVISPAASEAAVGAAVNLTVTGFYSDGSTKDMTRRVAWASSDDAIVSVDQSGLATCKSPGTAEIRAALNAVNVNTSAQVTVPGPPSLRSIVINSNRDRLSVGQVHKLTAVGSFSDGSNKDLSDVVTWRSSKGTVATVEESGVARGLAEGTTEVTATVAGMTGRAELRVTRPAVLTSMSVAPSFGGVEVGENIKFTATGNYSDGAQRDLSGEVTWQTSEPTIATIDNSGSAKGLKIGGPIGIVATKSGIIGRAHMDVRSLEVLSVASGSGGTQVGQTLQYFVSGRYSDGTIKDLSNQANWSSSDEKVAPVGSTGLVRGVAEGQATITATVGTLSGTASVNVAEPSLRSIAVSPPSAKIIPGSTVAFSVTGFYSDGSIKDMSGRVTWSSSDNGLAPVANSGVVIGNAPGAITITASLGGVSADARLYVVAPPSLQSIIVTPGVSQVELGVATQFKATGFYSDGSTLDVSSNSAWSSSNPAVATVSPSGSAQGLFSGGSAIIRASIGAVSAGAELRVIPNADPSKRAGVYWLVYDFHNPDVLTLCPSPTGVGQTST